LWKRAAPVLGLTGIDTETLGVDGNVMAVAATTVVDTPVITVEDVTATTDIDGSATTTEYTTMYMLGVWVSAFWITK
jgi:hypothetical protein